MAVRDPITSIRIHASTRGYLDALKASGQTYEDLILEMADEHFPPRLINQLRRRFALLRGPSADKVFRWAAL